MAAPSEPEPSRLDGLENVGRSTIRGVKSFGYGADVLIQSLYWLLLGPRHGQRIRTAPIFSEMMEMGIRAIPIVAMLSVTIGIMLAIQGIYQLKRFGAEETVVLGVAFGMTREFAPLITGILVAGRSGSALAARLGTMIINQEVDALRVMGINPIRFLVVPSLLAMMIMVPTLTLMADIVSLFGAGLYISADLGMTMGAYYNQTIYYLGSGDVLHGLGKSVIFAMLITLVAIVDGSSVEGGAEGVGKVTTNSVVHGITAIVLTDMVFAFATTRG